MVSAIYSSAAQQQAVTDQLILRHIAETAPLSVVMAEKLAALRTWAAGRTVNAN